MNCHNNRGIKLCCGMYLGETSHIHVVILEQYFYIKSHYYILHIILIIVSNQNKL